MFMDLFDPVGESRSSEKYHTRGESLRRRIMTEDECLTSRHGQQILAFFRTETVPVRTRWPSWKAARRFPVSEYKIRLVEAACRDRIAELLPGDRLRRLIGVARRQAADEIGPAKWPSVLSQADASLFQRVFDHDEWSELPSSRTVFAISAIGRLFIRFPWGVPMLREMDRIEPRRNRQRKPGTKDLLEEPRLALPNG